MNQPLNSDDRNIVQSKDIGLGLSRSRVGEHSVTESEEVINPCAPDWLNNEDNALLRGDAIGDTAYTHRWILRCLFTITENLPKYLGGGSKTKTTTDTYGLENTSTQNVDRSEDNKEEQKNMEEIEVLELDSEVEEAACQLWDMTVEKDVSHHLLNLNEFDILSLASIVFHDSRAPRLTEVMVGVIANLCCEEEGCAKVLKSKDGDEVLLSALYLLGSTSDIPTLCEVMRMIRLLLWHRTNRTSNTTWAACPLLKLLCQEHSRTTIEFLIQNSLSDTLIASLLELLSNFLYISLPETGLSVASLFSVEGIVNGIIDIFERKCEKFQASLEQEQEKIINWAILCLYAFIDTPGERLIQSSVKSKESKLESSLIYCLEYEGRVDSAEGLVDEVCEKLTRIIGLCQLLIPFIALPPLLMTVGRLMALVHGETQHYTVNPSNNNPSGRKSSLDDAVPVISVDSKKAKKVRWKSEGYKDKKKYKTQFSNPSAEECGWVSPPLNTSETSLRETSPHLSRKPEQSRVEGHNTDKKYKTLFSNPSAEDCGWVSPSLNTSETSLCETRPDLSRKTDDSSHSQTENTSTSNLANFKELEEVLGDYCFHLIQYWWVSNSCSKQRSKEAQEVILDVLDQCHAHEVLFMLNAVRLKDPSLVPKLQEEILDSGAHQRLVALLAHMYQ